MGGGNIFILIFLAGDPLGKGYGGTGIHLQSEFGSRSHNTGTVNMARVYLLFIMLVTFSALLLSSNFCNHLMSLIEELKFSILEELFIKFVILFHS